MMKAKILVTYASRSGSTAGVAETIGDVLREHDADVDVCLMQDVARYQAVVVGSAIQGQQWLPEAVQFIGTHRSEPKASGDVLVVYDFGDEKWGTIPTSDYELALTGT